MASTSLIKKLHIKPVQRMNPPPGYMDELGELPEGVELSDKPESHFDLSIFL